MQSNPAQNAGPTDPFTTGLRLIRVCPSAARAHDHGLVLLSAGLSYWVIPHADGYALMVEAGDVDELRRLIDRDTGPSRRAHPRPVAASEALLLPIILFWIYLGLFSTFLGNLEPGLQTRGLLDARPVLSHGEAWRAMTALTLHADAAHLTANLVAGFAATAALSQWVGSGRALLICLGSGFLGNLLTLVLRSSAEVTSLGASTAVFGALGALSAAPGTLATGGSFPAKWIPLATGLTVLGLYGAGNARTDILAHACGFAVGFFVGRLCHGSKRSLLAEPTRLALAFILPPAAWIWALLA